MRRRSPALFLAGLVCSLPNAVSLAQQRSFTSGTVAVRVDVLVTNGREPVAGLTPQDFELRDNGVPQRVDVLQTEEMPINVVLAFDTSSSTAGRRLADLIASSDALLDNLRPDDRVTLTTFSHSVTVRIPLTTDLAAVRSAVHHIVPSGQTSILDGAYVALMLSLTQAGRSLVIVCSDGYDTSSSLAPDEILDSAKRTNAVVYGVTAAAQRRHSPLGDLAVATGGDVILTRSSDELHVAFQEILRSFRSRYVLVYSPQQVAASGLHRLDVRVKRRGLTVKARSSYVGIGASDPLR
jgi:Ca-activated chloride channel family protein